MINIQKNFIIIFKYLIKTPLLTFLSITTLLLSCHSNNNSPDGKTGEQPGTEKTYKSPCGCVLTDKQMIMQCPVDAIGDSIIICKVGTNYVAGSGRGPMTWTEYMSSIYTGGEGTLVDCKTGKPLFKQLHIPVISYKKKQLVIDERLGVEVYDPLADKWLNLELPFWRKRVYAVNGALKITADSMVFKPPFHGPKAFASVSKEYEAELKKTDHYMITNTVYRLLTCSMCGDTLSKRRLLNIEQDFAGYYKDHDDSKELLNKALVLYHAYDDYLQHGGKRIYFNLVSFLIFKNNLKQKQRLQVLNSCNDSELFQLKNGRCIHSAGLKFNPSDC